MEKEKPDQLVQSLDRALNIIEELVETDKTIGVTELSNMLGIHKSTVHRLLATLLYRGYVERDQNGRYKVGLKLFEIGGRALNKMDLRNKIKPYLIKLQKETGETIHLGILQGNEIVYIDKEETTETIRMYSEVGRRIDAYCTSLGKVLLAYGDINVRDFFAGQELKNYTPNTIIDKNLLQKHLDTVKEKGFAIDNQEQEMGIRCIGGPIFNYDGKVIAAFSIAGPTTRMTMERVNQLSGLIKKYSCLISSSFGYIVVET
ncbi:MAG: IclR family transcriptional regulator [Halanaerobiaceae bacterium]